MIDARVARAGAVVLTGMLLTSCLLIPSAWAAGSDLQLDPGARGGALFSAGAMAPGRPVSRCVAVTATNGAGSPVDVRLYGRIAGALAPGLVLTVELGTGGSYDDCTAFTGTPTFSGTLADFGKLHADFSTGLRQTTGTATYRFTVELADDQQWQSLSATTQFLWEAQLDSPAAPLPPSPSSSPSPSPSVSPSPAPSPTSGPSSPAAPTPPGGTGTGTDSAPVLPSEPASAPGTDELVAPVPAPPAGPDAAPPAGDTPPDPGTPVSPAPVTDVAIAPGPSPADTPAMPLERPRTLDAQPERGVLVRTATRVVEGLRSTAAVVGHAATTGARAAGMPVGLMALVGLFLATQDRIDRSDPRLRSSPLHAPGMLEFLPADPA